jgi:putative membrane protein
MKLRTSIVAVATAALGAYACASTPPAQPPATTGATTSTSNPTTTPSDTSAPKEDVVPEQQTMNAFATDAEIAAFTEAANKGEVEQGHLALARAADPGVKAFARYMIEQHGQAEKSQERLMSTLGITPMATAPTTDLESTATSAVSSLGSLSGAAFDRAYIDLQVKEHQQVLNTLDGKLIPAVHDAEFKRELVNLRPKLEDHLRRAEALQQKLSGM